MNAYYQLQRKRAGARKPGAARKPGTPTTPTAFGRPRQLTSAAVLKKARKISSSGDGSRGGSGANPFHQAPSRLKHRRNPGAMTSSSDVMTSSDASAKMTSGNPFFAQLTKKETPAAMSTPTPFGEFFTIPHPVPPGGPPSHPQPPSYAAVVTGQLLQGSAPSFIMHGPGSIPQHEEGHVGHTHQLTVGPAQLSGDPPKILHLKNLPDHLNDPVTLKRHFSKYGEITVLDCQPGKRYATVGFSTREAAVRAKKSGRLLCEEPVQIFWHSHSQPKLRPDSQFHSHDPRLGSGGKEQRHAPPPPPPYMGHPSQPKLRPDLQFHSHDPRLGSGGMEQRHATPPPPPYMGHPPPQSNFPTGQSRFETGHQAVDDSSKEREEDHKRRWESDGGVVRKGLNMMVPSEVGGASKKSVWERLGGREGDSEEEDKGRVAQAESKAEPAVDADEWTPGGEAEDEGDEEGEEGVAEGRDSVLRVGGVSHETTDEMDTIARFVAHPYYLRSLHQPETIAGPSGPKAILQVPRPLSSDSSSISKVILKPRLPKVGVSSRTYAPRPVPVLPPPPMPRGQSAADLYDSLDTRDGEMRKNAVKQTSLTTAEVVVGKCPDMCPEKERYMREDRRRLSWFELDQHTSEPGAPRVDHQRAVKEYNRSAADKAEDLPHELRPEPILLMTMDYLVTCVMDEGDGKVELWYDFVWNRTRAIRKDITLQHLCSEGCVELTEKCARFHILCAYLLCEEEVSVFDQKMNNENLTKSLITLKQFYRDLGIEKNVLCENEAEFCCYDILLHLHDGDVLNTVEQYSPGVRQTSVVRHAIDIALAFSSNNYTKFFRIVRSSTCSFLSACIIHRYFTEMRTKALHVMIRAYTHSKPTNFPLGKFTDLLAFENEAMATKFCVNFDLSLTKKMIKLSREYTHSPSSSLPSLLAPSLVGAKRINRCLGEIVNGGPLPAPPDLPYPYDSFAPGTPLAPPTPLPAKPGYTDQDTREVGVAMEEEVLFDELLSIAMETLRNERDNSVNHATLCDFCEGVTSECVREECADVAMETLKNAQLEWQIRENTCLLEEVGKVVAMEMENGMIMEQVRQVAVQVFSDSYEEFVSEVTSICDDIIFDGVRSVTWEVSEEVMREAVTRRRERLDMIEKLVLRKRLGRYYARWRRGFKKRRHTRGVLSAIPSLPPLLPLSAQLTNRQRLLGETSVIDGGSLDVDGKPVAEFLEKERFNLDERQKLASAPLDLPSLLHHSLLVTRPPALPPLSHSHHTSPHLYWSLAILHTTDSAHSGHAHSDSTHFESGDVKLLEYLEQKLKFCPPGGESSGGKPLGGRNESALGVREISVSTTPLVGGGQLKIAVKRVCVGQSNRAVLTGVSAMMLLAPTPRGHMTPEDYRDDVIGRLMSVTEDGWWAETCVPMLVVAPFHVEEHFLAHWNALRIALQGLTRQPAAFISDVTFATLQINCHAPQQEDEVCKGLKWLADHTPRQPPLSCIAVRDYIEQGVQQYFLPLMTRDAETRRNNGLTSQAPHYLISLYNDVITHLANAAASDGLAEISWPVYEFAPRHFGTALDPHVFNNEGLPTLEWNGDVCRNRLWQCIMRYQLNQFEMTPPTTDDVIGWAGHCQMCLRYVDGYTGSMHRLLQPRVKALLHSYSSHMTFDQSSSTFPWDHVIITCIDHMVSITPSDVWVTCFHGDTKDFATPSPWLMAEATTSLECARSVTFEPRSPQPKRHRRHTSDSYVINSPHHFTPHIPTTLTHVTVSQSPLATKLTEKLGREKQQSVNFENQLKSLLSDSDVPSSPTDHTPLERSRDPADHAPDTTRWAGSLEMGVKLLRMKVKTSQFQHRIDSHHLQQLTLMHPSHH